ncbi:MAG: serine/threonine protein kinase [Planctomyces sp.]|nr:serine/threonine protein kinase [Planctomyces sp.]
MSLQLTTNSFCQLLEKSQLLTEEQQLRLQTELGKNQALSTASSIANWLIGQGWITQWQAEKLLQARHRGFFLGRYRLLNRIARGGMSTVYAAQHVESRAICALKVLSQSKVNHSSSLPRFYREAQLAARLEHPHIVKVFDVSSDNDGRDEIHFITMELLYGKDLAELVRSMGPRPCRVAADYIRQAALGLEYAHAAGLVHRDIKPGNLFLSEDGTIRILDLGLAQDFESEENLTREYNERVLGTADYLAPEQAVDSHSADARADLYGLGCTLYFLLTGQPPFNEGTLAQRIIAHQTKPLPSVAAVRGDVPEFLSQLLTQLVVKDRRKRIQSAGEVAQQITAWLDSDPSLDSIRSAPTEPPARSKRKNTDSHVNSPTDSIVASETDTTSNDSQRPVYQPEFAQFLAELDRAQKLNLVMDPDSRSAQLEQLSSQTDRQPVARTKAPDDLLRTSTWAHRMQRHNQWVISHILINAAIFLITALVLSAIYIAFQWKIAAL